MKPSLSSPLRENGLLSFSFPFLSFPFLSFPFLSLARYSIAFHWTLAQFHGSMELYPVTVEDCGAGHVVPTAGPKRKPHVIFEKHSVVEAALPGAHSYFHQVLIFQSPIQNLWTPCKVVDSIHKSRDAPRASNTEVVLIKLLPLFHTRKLQQEPSTLWVRSGSSPSATTYHPHIVLM